ncbi:hypothetical protein SAMN06265355_12057 [Actinomadura mexicana]|uniref:Uncharacterized protein n=1 Tax=Actinomadura mexicana TaxID=134959 RepID=A0A239FCJ1_9ACTN|nr:hypothetical protein SAMN06265355_12057 [Actinomadura mexicana]
MAALPLLTPAGTDLTNRKPIMQMESNIKPGAVGA